MWILFALTSATILASRKIQEKRLIWDVWWSLAWMIRIWSAISTGIIWFIFSWDFSITDPKIFWWIVIFVTIIVYPLQMKIYFQAIHELPLSVFWMMGWIASVSSMILSYVFLSLEITLSGLLGIFFVLLGTILLLYRPVKDNIPLKWFLLWVLSNVIMWFWSVWDRVAIGLSDPYTYSFIVQLLSSISLFSIAYFFWKQWLNGDFFLKNRVTILAIWISQGIWWVLSSFAIVASPNPGYASAIINTHIILTALYGVFILKEEITARKVFVFICMLAALISFAFA